MESLISHLITNPAWMSLSVLFVVIFLVIFGILFLSALIQMDNKKNNPEDNPEESKKNFNTAYCFWLIHILFYDTTNYVCFSKNFCT